MQVQARLVQEAASTAMLSMLLALQLLPLLLLPSLQLHTWA
jgi:hypothetical protein